MLGKATWFTRRQYSGWGLSPKTWQGWFYILLATGLIFLSQSLPVSATIRSIVLAGLVLVFLLDFLHILASIKLDEREAKIEAIAERNASWTMVSSLAVAIVYISTTQNQSMIGLVLPLLTGVLLTGLSAKFLSNLLLKNRDL